MQNKGVLLGGVFCVLSYATTCLITGNERSLKGIFASFVTGIAISICSLAVSFLQGLIMRNNSAAWIAPLVGFALVIAAGIAAGISPRFSNWPFEVSGHSFVAEPSVAESEMCPRFHFVVPGFDDGMEGVSIFPVRHS